MNNFRADGNDSSVGERTARHNLQYFVWIYV